MDIFRKKFADIVQNNDFKRIFTHDLQCTEGLCETNGVPAAVPRCTTGLYLFEVSMGLCEIFPFLKLLVVLSQLRIYETI